jgi:aryl-alcohol dehydrogenase-like predicted oxidoreductase
MKSAWETLDKKGIPLASNQVLYNLLDRRIESNGTLEMAQRMGITIIAYSPLAQGLVTGKFHDHPELIRKAGFRKYREQFTSDGMKKSWPVVKLVNELAQKYNVAPAQIALNWMINYHGHTVIVIPGATKEIHAKENTGAMSFRLSWEDMSKLDKVSAIFK